MKKIAEQRQKNLFFVEYGRYFPVFLKVGVVCLSIMALSACAIDKSYERRELTASEKKQIEKKVQDAMDPFSKYIQEWEDAVKEGSVDRSTRAAHKPPHMLPGPGKPSWGGCHSECSGLATSQCGTLRDWGGDAIMVYECRAAIYSRCMHFCAGL